MKKSIKILTCLAMCFSFSGCFSSVYQRKATNNIETVCSSCKRVNDIESLVENVEKVMNNVSGISGTYDLANTKSTFHFDFDIVTKDKKIDWDLAARGRQDDTEISLYLKDKKFYAVYPNNGANIILKDDLTKMVKEIEKTFDALNATYDRDNFKATVIGDKLEGFGLEELKKKGTYQVNSDGSYTISYDNGDVLWKYEITKNFLIEKVTSSAENFDSTLFIEYPKEVTIQYPNGLDFLTLNIEDVKKLLEVDNLAHIVDPDLKKK